MFSYGIRECHTLPFHSDLLTKEALLVSRTEWSLKRMYTVGPTGGEVGSYILAELPSEGSTGPD